MYKLLLVDDEPIIREGLERIIDWEKLDLKLTASCPNAIAALDSMTDDMPDILLTDIRLDVYKRQAVRIVGPSRKVSI